MRLKKEKYNHYLSYSQEEEDKLVEYESYFRNQAKLGNNISASKVVEFIDLLEKVNGKWENDFYSEYGYIKSNTIGIFSDYNFIEVKKIDCGDDGFYKEELSFEKMIDNLFHLIFEVFYNPTFKDGIEFQKEQLFIVIYKELFYYRSKLNKKKTKLPSDYFIGALSGYLIDEFGCAIFTKKHKESTKLRIKDYFDKSQGLISKAKKSISQDK